MYIFKLKLKGQFGEQFLSYSFPCKAPKASSTHTTKIPIPKGKLGWFKYKNEKEAIKAFISLVMDTLDNELNPKTTNIQSLGRMYRPASSCIVGGEKKEKEEKEATIKFLKELMIEITSRYASKYPEFFI